MKRLLKRLSSNTDHKSGSGSPSSSSNNVKPAIGSGYYDSNTIDPQREALTSPAVFCRTLESLVARDKYLIAQNPTKYNLGIFLEGDSPNVPWILKKFVIAALQEEVVTTEGIFRLGGSTKLVKDTREIIDKSKFLSFVARLQ